MTLDPREGARAEVAGPAETLSCDGCDGCDEQEPDTDEGAASDDLLGADDLMAGDEIAAAEEL